MVLKHSIRFTDEFLGKLCKMYMFDEGFSLEPYLDDKGFWTIGVGHYIGPSLLNFPFSKITKELAMDWLKTDINKAYIDVVSVFGDEAIKSWSNARLAAVHTLLFTLGRGKFDKFISTIPAIKENRWSDAAKLILQTKWARDVDPKQRVDLGRDDRIAYMLKTGEWHPDYEKEN